MGFMVECKYIFREADFPWKTNRPIANFGERFLCYQSQWGSYDHHVSGWKQKTRLPHFWVSTRVAISRPKNQIWKLTGPRSISAILTSKSSKARPSGELFIWRTGTSTARWRRRSAGCWWRPWCWAPGRRCPRPRPGAKKRERNFKSLQVQCGQTLETWWDWFLSVYLSVCLSVYLSVLADPSITDKTDSQANHSCLVRWSLYRASPTHFW